MNVHTRKCYTCQWFFGTDSSPWPGLSFKGGKFSLEESRGTKSESLFDTSCYHNEMYNVYAGKD